MPIGLFSNIAPLLSLILAFHILVFSMDVPMKEFQSITFGCVGSAEAENILEMVLEVEIDVHPTNSNKPGDCEKDAEKESSIDSIDVFHHRNQGLALPNYYHNFLSGQHKPCRHLKNRAQKISSPPPKV